MEQFDDSGKVFTFDIDPLVHGQMIDDLRKNEFAYIMDHILLRYRRSMANLDSQSQVVTGINLR